MKITNIEEQKRNQNRVNIYVDDLFTIGIEEELRFKYDLVVGMEVTDEFIKEILTVEEKNRVLNTCLKYLSFRQRSTKEVFDYLSRKEYDEMHILSAIDYCTENKYLDDYEFAKAYNKDKSNLNKWGPKRIKYELKLKGIDETIINEVATPRKEDEYEIAYTLAQKKINSYKNDDRNGKYRKLSGFLGRRGYSYDIISKVVKEILDEIED